MVVKEKYDLPKGQRGMTLFGVNNDDTTKSLPDIGFDFKYNGNTIRNLYVSGNSWVGFGTGSKHLKINERDGNYQKMFYAFEKEHGINLFRIRFEGNSSCRVWKIRNLIWELSIFETGVIRVVIEKMPNNGTNKFVNPGVGTVMVAFLDRKSFIFTPDDENGKKYIIEEGSYIPCNNKYLIVDKEGVKTIQTIDNQLKWVKIGELPLTEDMFKNYGIDVLPITREGIVENQPTLYHYTDRPDAKENKQAYVLKIAETVTSKPRVIVQNYDFHIHDGKSINRFESIIVTTKKSIFGKDIATKGKIRIAFSIDSGLKWMTFNQAAAKFEAIDINDLEIFINNGIDSSGLEELDYDALNALLSEKRKIRFAYILVKPRFEDICKLKKMKILYNEG